MVVTSQYGQLLRPSQSSQTKIWLMIDTATGRPKIRIANNVQNGVAYTDLGFVESAVLKGKSLRAVLEGGVEVQHLAAPCVCGAGAVGLAGPTAARHTVVDVRTDLLDWFSVA